MENKQTWKSIKDGWVTKSRTYVLVGDAQPPLRQIRSSHSHNSHLLYWDDEAKMNRQLRYYAAAKSPFIEDQPDEDIVVEHIYFRDGFLFTNITDVALQQFLSVHPDNGSLFLELKPEQTAEEEIQDFEARAEAYALVGKLNINDIEAVLYNEQGDSVFKSTSKELKKDLWVIADERPEYLLAVADDALILNKYIAKKAEKHGIIIIADSGRTLKWATTKKKICAVAPDSTPYTALADYFMTDDGVETKKTIVDKLKAFE